jgi:hypothetical protein
MSNDEPYTNEPELFDETSDSIASAWGLWHGFRQLTPKPNHNKSVMSNPYYYYPAFIVGYLLKVGVMILAAHYGLSL